MSTPQNILGPTVYFMQRLFYDRRLFARIINTCTKDRLIWCGRSQKVRYVNCGIHTGESFRNLIKSSRNQIVFTILRLIWNQINVRLVQNQWVHGK